MRAKDPRQAVIQTITNPNPQSKREERGILAKPESIIFIKEKDLNYIYTCLVSFTSTTDQKWYNTSLVIKNTDGSFSNRGEIGYKVDNRLYASKKMQEVYQHQPWLRISGRKAPSKLTAAQRETVGQSISETTEGGVTKRTVTIGRTVIRDDSAVDVSGYSLWVGHLIANGHDVASVRMIPHVGPVEEDEVQDSTVLFLSECTPPMTFEFYDPSHNLIATQVWDI